MTILGLGILVLVLFPLVAWANRPYLQYRRSYEEKFGISLHPELDAFYREADSGRRLDMLRLGPRVLLATLRSGRARRRDPALDRLYRTALLRRNLVVLAFAAISLLMILPVALRWL